VKIYIEDLANPITWADSATVEVSTGVEDVRTIGQRQPRAIQPGDIEITGTIEGLWINEDLIDEIKSPTSGGLNLCIYVGSDMYVYVTGAYLDGFSFETPRDGWLRRSIDFRAKDFYTYTVSSGEV